MSEQRDNTPEQDEPSRTEREREAGNYYYDDSTGYEVYNPTKDDEEEENDEPVSTER